MRKIWKKNFKNGENMKEQGIVIFPNGKLMSFGIQVYTDEPNYLASPSHESSFKDEIANSFEFRLANFTYDEDKSLYQNAIELSLNRLLLIFNNTPTTKSKLTNLCYMPGCPTQEQLSVLIEKNYDSIFEANNIYEFQSIISDDYIEYENFSEYLETKSMKRL